MKKLIKLTAIMLVALMAMSSPATAKTRKKSHRNNQNYSQTVHNAAAAQQGNYEYSIFERQHPAWHLLIACQKGDLATVKKLVESKTVDVNDAYNVLIGKPIAIVIAIGDVPATLYNTNDEAMKTTYSDGETGYMNKLPFGTVFEYTPLIMAAEFGHVEVAKYLLAHGANINIETSLRENALSTAAYYRHFAMVKYLVSAGATDLSKAMHAVPNQKYPDYPHWGAGSYQEGVQIVDFLVSKGAK